MKIQHFGNLCLREAGLFSRQRQPRCNGFFFLLSFVHVAESYLASSINRFTVSSILSARRPSFETKRLTSSFLALNSHFNFKARSTVASTPRKLSKLSRS